MSAKSAMDILNKDYDYIRIPKERILSYSMSSQEYRCPVETEIRFVGEPILEKVNIETTPYGSITTTKNSSISINNNGICMRSSISDEEFKKLLNGRLDANDYCTLNELKNNKMEGKKDMNKLLEIYKIKRIEEIDDKYSELRKGILQHDPLVQAAEEYNKKLEENLEDKTLVEEYKLNPERRVTTASKNILNDIEYKHEKEWEQIDDLLKTIQAHLDIADTFEQKQQILINYGIINSNGRLNINKEEVKEEIKYAVEKQPKKVAKKMFRKE